MGSIDKRLIFLICKIILSLKIIANSITFLFNYPTGPHINNQNKHLIVCFRVYLKL